MEASIAAEELARISGEKEALVIKVGAVHRMCMAVRVRVCACKPRKHKEIGPTLWTLRVCVCGEILRRRWMLRRAVLCCPCLAVVCAKMRLNTC